MKKILVADDNPISRELICESLDGDYVLVEASDGLEAVNKIREESPDLALLDIQMPVVDGFGVLRAIRADAGRSRIPLVALTAFAMYGDSEKALAAGFDAYITKPVNLPALRAQVRALLGE